MFGDLMMIWWIFFKMEGHRVFVVCVFVCVFSFNARAARGCSPCGRIHNLKQSGMNQPDNDCLTVPTPYGVCLSPFYQMQLLLVFFHQPTVWDATQQRQHVLGEGGNAWLQCPLVVDAEFCRVVSLWTPQRPSFVKALILNTFNGVERLFKG